jgi:hypothetical protein
MMYETNIKQHFVEPPYIQLESLQQDVIAEEGISLGGSCMPSGKKKTDREKGLNGDGRPEPVQARRDLTPWPKAEDDWRRARALAIRASLREDLRLVAAETPAERIARELQLQREREEEEEDDDESDEETDGWLA